MKKNIITHSIKFVLDFDNIYFYKYNEHKINKKEDAYSVAYILINIK